MRALGLLNCSSLGMEARFGATQLALFGFTARHTATCGSSSILYIKKETGKAALMIFSEDSRVKIPCILHLVRLGYRYLSLKNAIWDEETNIFPDLFRAAMVQINSGLDADDIDQLLTDVKLLLENEALGKAFYEKITERSGIRLIDLAEFSNNSFHVVTELTCKNGDDEFRPDITLLINAMPLVFIEVKKLNNREGVLAERNRIITRCRNPRFRRFLNITQLMVFSTNMEYDDGSPQLIEGAFYASPSYDVPTFNYFREEEELFLSELLAHEDDSVENEVLKDNNLSVIKHSPEFASNKSPDTPTKKNPEYWNGYIPFFTPTDADGTMFKFSTADSITEEGLKKSSTKLFAKDTVFITARGSVGKLVLTGSDMAMNQSCYALCAKPGISHTYLFFLAKELIHHLQVKSSGSVFNSIVSNDIQCTLLAIPDSAVVEKYAAVVEPAFERIANNTKENQHLTHLRDWLLPLLMNGQVTVA
ncbi:hypothetical protein DPPLL_06220 [Desulfofustis limnaeus]|uniref:type I site-specific deoxyribonuclease n=1 Tax=Desulfofustis limnaeus TaxID=2740163 RepID=A0ABM7W5Q5_9BACT|nr:hypothetical protein DPPLL_06220 [Desulfofustis limnaeus]